ncbi:MAG: sulfotransferase [Rhodobiaceae bacterium]|nr:sulfotransferase [Rhodobiaceae bacterium]MCC0055867.1 sulfotransferase [Rhodobiaceae bacterium]
MSISVDKAMAQAKAHIKKGEIVQARFVYESVLSRFPGNQRARDALAKLNSGTGMGTTPVGDLRKEDFDRAYNLFLAGRLQEARAHAVALLQQHPRVALLHSFLGGIHARMNEHEVALGHYRRSLELDPTNADAHSNLSASLLTLNRPDDARASVEEAIRLKPDRPNAQVNLGNILVRQGLHEEAVAAYRQALRLSPGNADALVNMGGALHELKKYDEAIAALLKAREGGAASASLHYNLGRAYKKANRWHDAEVELSQAVRLSPGDVDAWLELGKVAFRRGNMLAALEAGTRAVDLAPERAVGHALLGMCHRNLGNMAEEEACIVRALELDPEDPTALYEFAERTRFTADDPMFTRVAEAYEKTEDLREKSSFAFALAKASQDTGDFDAAFGWYQKGNALRAEVAVSRKAEDLRAFANLRKTFERREHFTRLEAVADGPRPIFVLGMPRSGTTLVEQILASHSQVFGADELTALPEICAPVFEASSQPPDRFFAQANLAEIRARYLGEVRKLCFAERVFVDKMPFNFAYVGVILAAFPEARIVHTVRDKVAVCWSIYTRNFGNDMWFAQDFDDLAEYYGQYRRMMAFWHEKFPGAIYDLNYEKLTENQEDETRRLLDHCGLAFEAACLNFQDTERAVRTASVRQVRQKMYTGSSNAWRNYEKHIGPLLRALDPL